MYEQYLVDKDSVDPAWWPVLEAYHRQPKPATDATTPTAPPAEPGAAPAAPAAQAAPTAEQAPQADAPSAEPNAARPLTAPIPVIGSQPAARTTSLAPKPVPVPADVPITSPQTIVRSDETETPKDEIVPLRGMAKSLA